MAVNAPQGIPLEVRHRVPAIRWDERAGRERLAFLTARAPAVLRTIPPGTFERHASTGRTWSLEGVEALPDEYRFEGRAWTRQSRGSLDAFLLDLSKGRGFERNRGLGFTDGLTLASGKGLPDRPEPLGIIARYDDEAARFVRSQLATDFAFDGTTAWIADYEDWKGDGPVRRGNLMTGLYALMMAAEIPGIDREIEERSAPVRRVVARNSVGALEAHELPDAYRAVLRLCERLAELRRRGPKAATARMWVGQLEGQIARLRTPALPADDAISLGALA